MAGPSQPNSSLVTDVGGPPNDAEQLNVVETPTSPSSGLALSRFEFETGKGNEGTKILMVDWDTSVGTAAVGTGVAADATPDWEVSWEGKTTVLPIRDEPASESGGGSPGGAQTTRRVYFLLPPGAPIPPLITISRGKKGSGGPELHTKPMPAIFHPDLGVGIRDVGKRGVLHTIWAKKRLSELQAEIDVEMKSNGESVGLEMALQERQWIVDHFGLSGGGSSSASLPSSSSCCVAPPTSPVGPTSPRSPVGKLSEKLKGLKLATSPTELAAASQAARQQAQMSTLSPQAADVAVSSFSSFRGAAAAAPRPAAEDKLGGVASLDAMLGGQISAPHPHPSKDGPDTEEDLFALPMSPRSPEMKRSPFSML